MASLKNIKLKILSYKKTGTVTHAMEAVSAVKMRKGQERALGARAYAASALAMLERLAATADIARHPLLQEARAEGAKTCFVVITSDKGLAGSLNSGVIKAVEREMTRLDLIAQNTFILAIGKRGGDYFAARGFEVGERRENRSDSVSEGDMRSITDTLLALQASGKVGAAFVAYQNFISTFEQHPSVRQIIPITPACIRDMVAGIRPVRGKYAPVAEAVRETSAVYTIEPDPDTVLTELLPRLLTIAIFHALLESKASEHSARMVAMKSATDKAKEMAQNLTRTFNKVRQAAITREVSEITSGIEAMK